MVAKGTRVEVAFGHDGGDREGRSAGGFPASGGPDPVDGSGLLAVEEDPTGAPVGAETVVGGRPTTRGVSD